MGIGEEDGELYGSGWIRPLPTRQVEPTHLRTTLDRLASTMGLASVAAVEDLFLAWDEIVGKELGRHCRPVRLESGLLTVVVSSPQWATELSWMKLLLVERCNTVLGEGEVTDLKVKT